MLNGNREQSCIVSVQCIPDPLHGHFANSPNSGLLGWVSQGKLSPCNTTWRHGRAIDVQLYPVWTSAIDWSGWSTPHPCCFTAVKEPRYPFDGRLSGHHDRAELVWRRENPLPFPPGFESRFVQLLASRWIAGALLIVCFYMISENVSSGKKGWGLPFSVFFHPQLRKTYKYISKFKM